MRSAKPKLDCGKNEKFGFSLFQIFYSDRMSLKRQGQMKVQTPSGRCGHHM